MNKRQRKKLLKQQAEALQSQKQEVLAKLQGPTERTRSAKTRRRAIERASHQLNPSSPLIGDPIEAFVQRKKDTLKRSVHRFDKLIDAYVEEQVQIRRETIKREREKFLQIELPPYVDYEEEMSALGYNLRKGQLKVIPDLDFMANEYFQWWERAFQNILSDSGRKQGGLEKMLGVMSYDLHDLAVQTFIERQHEDPRSICADARRLIEREITEYGERYAEEKAKTYALTNKSTATGRRK